MIALDTNLLVYAHRAGAPEHVAARQAIDAAAGAGTGWGFALASVAEFWAVVTRPSLATRPSTKNEARIFIDSLIRHGGAQVWRPLEGFESRLLSMASALGVSGPRVFDLQIGLAAYEGGARSMWTHDAGFAAPPGLSAYDPLVHPAP